MKKILILIFLIGLFAIGCSSPPDPVQPAKTQTEFVQASDLQISVPVMNVADEVTLPVPDTPAPGILDSLKNNWAALLIPLLALIKVAVNLTPTQSDNKIFGLLDTFINWIIPNLKKGGGTHT